jgi:hypothetical protein
LNKEISKRIFKMNEICQIKRNYFIFNDEVIRHREGIPKIENIFGENDKREILAKS